MKFAKAPQNLDLLTAVLICLVMFAVGSLRYTGFASVGVLTNLLDDNSFLGIAAVGMTFVILSGGIDLSVGSVVGLTSIATALLIQRAHFSPGLAIALVVLAGMSFGALMGWIISFFEMAPFLVTLAGMFFARGLAYTLSLESVQVTNAFYASFAQYKLPFGVGSLQPLALCFLLIAGIGYVIAAHTRIGRAVYAFGGNPQSARLMGINTHRTQIFVYALSGTTAALAGVAYTLYTSSGNATSAQGLELDAIAAVVLGGTLLSGGQGSVLGTCIGLIILGLVQTMITFESTLSSWWTKIAIGGLLLFFVVFQRAIAVFSAAKNKPRS